MDKGAYNLVGRVVWHYLELPNRREVLSTPERRVEFPIEYNWIIDSYRSAEIVVYLKDPDSARNFFIMMGLIKREWLSEENGLLIYRDADSPTFYPMARNGDFVVPFTFRAAGLGSPPRINIILGNGCGIDRHEMQYYNARFHTAATDLITLRIWVVQCNQAPFAGLQQFILYQDHEGNLRLIMNDRLGAAPYCRRERG